MGRSIGSGPTVNLAAKKPCCGVILVTPFMSAAKVVLDSSLVYPIDFFRNADAILEINAPIKIIHGTEDSVIPLKHGKQLYKMIKSKGKPYKATWIKNADHNDLDDFPEYLRCIDEFMMYCEELEEEHTYAAVCKDLNLFDYSLAC